MIAKTQRALLGDGGRLDAGEVAAMVLTAIGLFLVYCSLAWFVDDKFQNPRCRRRDTALDLFVVQNRNALMTRFAVSIVSAY